jgi:hypothetical protein
MFPVISPGKVVMSHQMRRRILHEAEIIERFAQTYSGKFDTLIQRLNTSTTPASVDGQSLRLCVEAMNMVVSMQGQLARALVDL